MKILMICTEKLPVPPVRGGAIQTYIAGIAPALARHHDLTILGRTDPSLPDSETIGTVQYERVPGGLFDVYRDNVRQFLQNRSYDLIHIFNRPLMVEAVREAAPNARIILSMHNDMFTPEKINPEQAERAIAEVERIVTVSDYIGHTISGPYPQAEDKLRTVYSGVDLHRYLRNSEAERIRQTLRQEHSITNKKVILFVGRLSPKKGADILVRSMTHVVKQHPDAALVLVGSRWYSDNDISDYVAFVRAIANRSPVPVVTTGFVDAALVHQWFWAGDVFVCPSQWEEPLARVHYEAMAAELPILTTKRGGNPEVIELGRNGLLIEEPDNPLHMAERINALLADSRRMRDMGRHGRTLAEQNYGWERVERNILDVWS
jgi:spore coat protein SA